jgi:hypothetical protein
MRCYVYEWNGARWAITEDDDQPPTVSKIASVLNTERVGHPIYDALHMITAWRRDGKPGEVLKDPP